MAGGLHHQIRVLGISWLRNGIGARRRRWPPGSAPEPASRSPSIGVLWVNAPAPRSARRLKRTIQISSSIADKIGHAGDDDQDEMVQPLLVMRQQARRAGWKPMPPPSPACRSRQQVTQHLLRHAGNGRHCKPGPVTAASPRRSSIAIIPSVAYISPAESDASPVSVVHCRTISCLVPANLLAIGFLSKKFLGEVSRQGPVRMTDASLSPFNTHLDPGSR